MSNVRVVPFNREHLKALNGATHHDIVVAPVLLSNVEYLAFLEASSTAWSAFLGDKYLGSAGFIPECDGLHGGWMVASAAVARHPITFHKLMKAGIKMVVDEYGLSRLRVLVEEANANACRWIERVGFVLTDRWPQVCYPGGITVDAPYLVYERTFEGV